MDKIKSPDDLCNIQQLVNLRGKSKDSGCNKDHFYLQNTFIML